MRVALRLILLTVFAALGMGTVAHAAPRTVIFNLNASPLDRPERIFFQANSGPYLADLVWSGWGTDTATGSGFYVLDCETGGSACGTKTGIERYPARYALTRQAACPRFDAGSITYLKGVVVIDRPEGQKTVRFDSDADGCAKRPTTASAKKAIRRSLRKSGSVGRLVVTCRVTGPTDLECKARYTRRGKRQARSYFVFGRRTAAPSVSRLGG